MTRPPGPGRVEFFARHLDRNGSKEGRRRLGEKMNAKHLFIVILALILALDLGTSRRKRRAQATQRRLDRRLGLDRAAGSGRHRSAVFSKKKGCRPRYIQFQGTNLMLSALMANELDYVTILPFIAGAATRGLPVKIVAATVKTERLRDHLPARHRQRQGAQRQENSHQHLRQLGGLRDLSTAQPQRPRS